MGKKDKKVKKDSKAKPEAAFLTDDQRAGVAAFALDRGDVTTHQEASQTFSAGTTAIERARRASKKSSALGKGIRKGDISIADAEVVLKYPDLIERAAEGVLGVFG